MPMSPFSVLPFQKDGEIWQPKTEENKGTDYRKRLFPEKEFASEGYEPSEWKGSCIYNLKISNSS